MFNSHFLSISNGLDIIQRFLFGWDLLTEGEIVGILG